MRRVEQQAGETAAQYVDRLESELERARDRTDRLESELERARDRTERLERDAAREQNRILKEHEDELRDRDFLREQLTELSQQIRSVSAPRTRQQMRRLLDGLLRGHDWRNGTWR